MKKILGLALVILSSATWVNSQSFESEIDSLGLSVFTDQNGPGGVILIAKDGKTIYQKAFGKANLELDVDLTPESVFQIGSMTKQFTAVAILQLEEEGKLDVNHSVSRYIPDYPSGDQITLHHLLTHTSGIKDFTKMKAIRDIAKQDLTPTELVDFFKNEPVDFQPGEKFDYNNSGYVVLGHIIELVSGETYADYIQKYIFDKAGMCHSGYASDAALVNNRAYGYHQKAQGFVNKNSISFNIPFSSGALMSTAGDMLKWQNALNQDLLLSANTLNKVFTKYKLNNGDEFTYGYGWHLKDINGTPTREHGGSIFGFKSMGVYIPSEDIYVLGLSNCDCHSPTKVVGEMAALALKTVTNP
jgi:CubicO group peptidase (beta-lactamase class C family)